MPYCPSCRYEYVEGVKTCPDCGVDLVDQLPEEPEHEETPAIEEEFVPVFGAENTLEAEIIRDLLLEAGIPVLDKSDANQWPTPISAYLIGNPNKAVILTVPASCADRAREVISQAEQAGDQMVKSES